MAKNRRYRSRVKSRSHDIRSSASRQRVRMELLEDRLMLASHWQNTLFPTNVNGSSEAQPITPLDVLLVVSELLSRRVSDRNTGNLPELSQDKSPPPFLDVNGDMRVTSRDALLVISDVLAPKPRPAGSSQPPQLTPSAPPLITPVSTGLQNKPEFRVNSTVNGSQEDAAVAIGPGGFVETWSSLPQDGGGWGVFGQRFDNGGAPIGPEFRVNQTTRHDQSDSSAAMGNDGRFVVVWQSYDQRPDGNNWGIFARVFSPGQAQANGTQAAASPAGGPEILVNETTRNAQQKPRVAMLSDGSFVVAWQGVKTQGFLFDDPVVLYRRFSADGTPLSSERRVSTGQFKFQSDPAITALPGGGFAIAWQNNPILGSPSVYVRRFDASGNPVGGETAIDSSFFHDAQTQPSLAAAADGRLLVAWTNDGFANGKDVDAQIIGTNGRFIGSRIHVNQYKRGIQQGPSVAVGADGKWIVAWEGKGSTDDNGVFMRSFTSSGQPVGADERVSATTAGDQRGAAIAASQTGLVIAWDGNGPGDQRGVFSRIISTGESDPPVVTFALLNDTARGGGTNSDLITKDPTIQGSITDASRIIKLRAALGAGPFVDIFNTLQPNNTFQLNRTELERILGGPLVDGSYTLRVQAEDEFGNASTLAIATTQLTFQLDTAAPAVAFGLAPESDSDPVDDDTTELAIVSLVGQTEANTALALAGLGSGQSDPTGLFRFDNVSLALGNDDVHVQAEDVAGNVTDESKVLTRVAPGTIALAEANRFVSERSMLIDLGQTVGSRHLQFHVDAHFDTTDHGAALEDIFLVYLVDPAHPDQTLLDRGQPGSSLFSLAGDHAEFVPGLVRFDGSVVDVDLTSLGNLTQGMLLFQLLNSDADNRTHVNAGTFTNVVDAAAEASPTLAVQSRRADAAGAVDLSTMSVTQAVNVSVQNVRFNATTGRYTAELAVRNNGAPLGRQVVVAFPDLPSGVTLHNPSGADNAGIPYLNLRNAIGQGGLLANGVSGVIDLEFDNPTLARFAIRPVVYVGGPNHAPTLPPIGPLSVTPGDTLTVPLNAADLDGDLLDFAIDTSTDLPTGTLRGGVLQFKPELDQLGLYSFDVIVTDGVLQTRRTVALSVVADPNTMTRISGRIENTEDDPLAGVPVEIAGFSAITASDGSFTINLPTLQAPTESFDIPIPAGDPFFDPLNTGDQVIRFRRARFDVTTGDSITNPRQHPNLVTSFIDAGIVYGSDSQRAAALRTFVDGKLKSSAGNMLPLNDSATFPNGVLQNDNEGRLDPALLFVGGDVRTNENVPLIALHTLLMREHNRLAGEIKAAHPAYTDEQIYQQARSLVAAMIEQITYSEYLPLLLGPSAIPAYTGYDPNVNPSESALFSVAAFRVGHTQLFSQIERLDSSGQSLPGGPLSLQNAFFTPQPIKNDGIEPFLRGMAASQAQQVDAHVIDDVRNFLFGPPGSGGMDLPSLNIQRGRDMGLPSYNQARQDFGLPPAATFADITSDPAVRAGLQSAYGTVDKVDVWVGGVSEDRAPGALIGPLFQRIVADQFRRARDGDRYWYENGQFTTAELAQIRSTTLEQLILRNTSIADSELPGNVFTTGAAPAAPAPAGSAAGATSTDFRSINGLGNNLAQPALGSKGQNLLVNFTQQYGDGISTPAGADRPDARVISNLVNAQTGSIPNTAGATGFVVFWGQIIDHDLGLTPGGVSDTLKVLGNQRPGPEHYPFVAERMDLLLDHPVFPGVNNVIDRTIYLPQLDSGDDVPINPAVDTLVTTSKIPGAQLLVRAGNLHDRTGNGDGLKLSITEVPRDLTPAALPTSLIPDLVVTIQPADMVFTTPAPITFPNRAGWEPGTLMNLWSINPVTGVFDDVGDMRVSADGSVIETISGGIRNSSWHFPAPPDPDPDDTDDDDHNKDDDCGCCQVGAPGHSSVELHSGALREEHELVTYQSLGTTNGLTLHYDSERADPRQILHFGYSNAVANSDRRLVARLEFTRGDFAMQVPGNEPGQFGLPGGENFWSIADSGSIRAALLQDFSTLPSGVYDFSLDTGILRFADGLFTGSTSNQTGHVVNVNGLGGIFGNGWGLGGLQQIIENPDASVLLIDGDGSERLFEPPVNRGEPFVSPHADFTVLTKEPDGTYRRTWTDGTVQQFNRDGFLDVVRDRNGNETRYEYSAPGRLTRIIDPVGLETSFVYTGDHVTQIVDPAHRVTTLQYDAAGNLQRVIDPDDSQRTWEYDARSHITAEVDKRGFREEIDYSFSGQVVHEAYADGTERFYDPVQAQVLMPSDATLDPVRPPAVHPKDDAVGRYADPNGNVTEVMIDQSGQLKSARDGAGRQSTVTRDEEHLVIGSANGRGFTTDYTHDERGNVLTIVDTVPVIGRNGSGEPIVYENPGDPVLRTNPGFNTSSLAANDDGSTGLVSLGLDANFFGTTYTQIFVNNNGNITFDSSLSTYTPFNLLSTNRVMLAPFFADVDTRGVGTVTYGTDTVSGREAFGVNWTDVGHYNSRTSKRDTFQLVLVDRSDLNPGDFDIEFNYAQIQWETGDFSGGSDGLGGNSARAGYSNGLNQAFEIEGSAVNGALLDTNDVTGLIHNRRNSLIDGRYRFEVRNGEVTSGATTEYTYDDTFSQVTSVRDPQGRQTLFDIDPTNGNQRHVTQIVGEIDSPQNGEHDDLVTAYTYDSHGLLDTATDPLGHVTDYDYDSLGRLVSVTFAKNTADEAIVRYEYDLAGNQTAMIDGNGHRTESEYDPLNRLIQMIEADPDGVGPLTSPITAYVYDATGNLQSMTDARGNTSTSEYDPLNREISSAGPDPDGNGPLPAPVTRYSYDEAGNVSAVTDPLGHVTRYRYDSRNRRIEMTDPDGGVTKFAYDTDNNLAVVIDPVGNTTRFVYDARSRLIEETDPLGKKIIYSYDASNNLTKKVDRNGRETRFVYDSLDRLVSEHWFGTGNTEVNEMEYIYDVASNLLSVTDNQSALVFTYDARNRIKTVDNSGAPGAPSVVLTYSYDDANNVLSVVDTINGSGGATTGYQYDALDRLLTLTQAGAGFSDKRVDFSYNSLGQYAGIDRFRDLAGTQLVIGTDYSYDSQNRLTRIDHKNAQGTSVAFYDYVYDVSSRISRITDVDGTTDYGYDDRNELTSALHADPTNPDETYQYDANGNRLASHLHGTAYQTGPANRLLSDGTYNYEYDDEGNIVRRTESTTGNYRIFVWDYRNRLTAVNDFLADNTAVQVVTFTYDANNRRLSKAVDSTPLDAVNAVLTHFVYDREDVIIDFVDSDGAGALPSTLDQRYLHGVGIDRVYAQDDGMGAHAWMLTDHLGSIRDIVTDDNVVNHIAYDGFGNIVHHSHPALSSRYGFTGREFDGEAGLMYMRARYYDTQIGRFISTDPLSLTGSPFNVFRYGDNSPIRYDDPFGLAPIDPRYIERCRSLEERIRNLTDEVDRRTRELYEGRPAPGCGELSGNIPGKTPGDDLFGGSPGDSRRGHQALLNDAKRRLAAAQGEYAALCNGQDPEKEPAPKPTENHLSPIDWKYWEQVTGLTGWALILYLLFSEGSRVFPPRNAVPVI